MSQSRTKRETRWTPIENYPNYLVSDTGDVFSKLSNKTLYKEKNTAGYYRVRLGVPQKKFFIHNLVAKTYCEGYFEGAVVNHKDFNKCNNHYTNLEWITRSDNSKHAYKGGKQTGAFTEILANYLYKGVIYYNKTVKEMCNILRIRKSSFYNYLNKGKVSRVSNDYPERE